MKRNTKEGKNGIFIISVANKLRNPDLIKEALEFWPGASIELIHAVTPKSIKYDLLTFLQHESSLLLGRQITEAEIACAQSHRKCYSAAIENGYTKALILEDDIKISKGISISQEDLERLDLRKNIIISFYSPKWSVWLNRKSKIIALFPPAYAAAYLINESGLKSALINESFGLADWPTWSRKFKFFLTSGSQFDMVPSDSFLEADRRLSKAQKKGKYICIRKKNKNHNLKIIDILKYRVIYPLLWKLLGTKSGVSSIIKSYL
jgi:hypothetical protein